MSESESESAPTQIASSSPGCNRKADREGVGRASSGRSSSSSRTGANRRRRRKEVSVPVPARALRATTHSPSSVTLPARQRKEGLAPTLAAHHLHLQRPVSLRVYSVLLRKSVMLTDSDAAARRYAPALRPLRTMARIVRFHPPTTAHLTKRLRAICDIEGLKADNKTLTTLVEVAEGDMRSCLNTLQVGPASCRCCFSSLRSADEALPASCDDVLNHQIVRTQSDTLHEKMIRSTALGLKDTATSVTAVWDKLFRTPSKKRQKGIEEAIGDKYVSPLVKDISTCGEYDKLAQSKLLALSLLLLSLTRLGGSQLTLTVTYRTRSLLRELPQSQVARGRPQGYQRGLGVARTLRPLRPATAHSPRIRHHAIHSVYICRVESALCVRSKQDARMAKG